MGLLNPKGKALKRGLNRVPKKKKQEKKQDKDNKE